MACGTVNAAKDAEDTEEIGTSGHLKTKIYRGGMRMSADCKERRAARKLSLCRCREGMGLSESGCGSSHPDIGPSDHREIGTPPRAAVPHEHAEVHNSSLRDERLPKGPRFASESLDADTVVGSVLQTEPYANLG
jgi:hypothetical protein